MTNNDDRPTTDAEVGLTPGVMARLGFGRSRSEAERAKARLKADLDTLEREALTPAEAAERVLRQGF